MWPWATRKAVCTSAAAYAHGHTVGATGVETMQIQHLFAGQKTSARLSSARDTGTGHRDRQLLEVPKHWSAVPSARVPCASTFSARCIKDILFPFDLNQGVPGCAPATQVFDNSRSQRQLWQPLRRPGQQFPETSRPQERPHPWSPSSGTADVRQCRHRQWQFARSIRVEVQMARDAAVQVIEGRHTAGQDTRAPPRSSLSRWATASKRDPSTIQTSGKCSRRVCRGAA